MGPFPNIRRAGAGHRPCARRLTATLAILLAFAVHLIAPPAVEAASGGGPGAGSAGNSFTPSAQSPQATQSSHRIQKQPCGVLLSARLSGGSAGSGCQEPSDANSGNAVPVVDLNPAHAAGDALGAAGDVVDTVTGAATDAVTGTILDGFKAIIGFLFGGLQSAITVALIKWIATVPNLSDGHVGDLEASIAVGAGGLLAATMTISIVRFWGSGLTGDGAWAGAEGVARAAVAATLIGLWPQIFDLAVRLSNALQHGILDEAVQAQLKALFRDLDVIGLGGGAAVGLASGVISGGLVPLFLAIVIAIVGMLMLLALVAMKIVITALTIVLFCAMPLALVLWPIPELSGLAKLCLRSLGVALAIPVIWCLVFGAFAAIGADTFSFHNTGKDEDIFGTALNVTIVRPLVAISLLYLALVLPRRLLQMAPMMGGGRAGFGRALATGATLRAGFHYGPQAGRMALDRASQMGGVAGRAAGRFGGGATAATGAAGRTSGEPTAGGGAAKEGKASGQTSGRMSGPGRPEHGTNKAPEKPGSEAKAAGTAGGQASGRIGEGSSATSGPGKAGATGYAAMSDAQHAAQMERDSQFGGPRMSQPDPHRNEQIRQRAEGMLADSGAGSTVSRSQASAAANDLNGRSDLLESARRAAFKGTPEQAAGAFAEWSLTDNPHVSDQHRGAFQILGSASPSQRQNALGALGSGAAPQPSKRPRQKGDGSNGNGDGGRVPGTESQSHEPPPRRTPHTQPGSNGGAG
jgi:hypothetical protein